MCPYHAKLLQRLALACEALDWKSLGCGLMAISQALEEGSQDVTWVADFVDVFCQAAVPKYSRWIIQRFLETVERGSPEYQLAGLLLLKSFFEVRQACQYSWNKGCRHGA